VILKEKNADLEGLIETVVSRKKAFEEQAEAEKKTRK